MSKRITHGRPSERPSDDDVVIERLRRPLEFLGLTLTLTQLDERLAWATQERPGVDGPGYRRHVAKCRADERSAKMIRCADDSAGHHCTARTRLSHRCAAVVCDQATLQRQPRSAWRLENTTPSAALTHGISRAGSTLDAARQWLIIPPPDWPARQARWISYPAAIGSVQSRR